MESENIEVEFRDLLAPLKDIEKSFDVDVSFCIHRFLSKLDGSKQPDFNSAAVILHRSAHVYGKKVECLHNLVTKLLGHLSKKDKATENKNSNSPVKKSSTKEKEKKEKPVELYFPVDIKRAKHLSYLRKKNAPPNAAKKGSQKPEKVFSLQPAYLLPLDDDNKGDAFYDTRGNPVGQKGDYVLNKCLLTSWGWLLLPTVSSDFIPTSSEPDYTIDCSTSVDLAQMISSLENDCPIAESADLPGSPDEGIGSAPMSLGTASAQSTPFENPNADVGSQDNATPCSNMSSSETPCSDEGIVSDMILDSPAITDTPATDVPATTDAPATTDTPTLNGALQPDDENVLPIEERENIPVDDVDENTDVAPNPVRRSTRKALQECQLQQEEAVTRKIIQKKNVLQLPTKLRTNDKVGPPEPLSAYCNIAFYAIENKVSNSNQKFSLDVYCLKQNAGIHSKLQKLIELVQRSLKHKSQKNDDSSEDEMAEDDSEDLRGDDDDRVSISAPFESDDIQINNDPDIACGASFETPPCVEAIEDVPEPDAMDDSLQQMEEEVQKYMKGAKQFMLSNDISKKVHAWEESIQPYLTTEQNKPPFDINTYGASILDSFEDSNRKQTKTFKDICKGKYKWEVHRCFMALLPLANIGNVSLECENNEDGTEDIQITLLSRKMHHKELENFGHNKGSHD